MLPSDIPSNAGFQRPVSVVIPEGSILAPRRPAPRAARGLTGFRAIDAVLGALAQAAPERVMAAGEGGATMIAMGGTDSAGDAFVFVDFMCGGWGARPGIDGIDGVSALAANLANVPVEEIELDQPVRVRRYGFVPDTGGPGRWRGCLSVVRELEFREERGLLQVRSDRRRFLPYGLAGGREGTPSTNVLDPDGEARLLPTNTTTEIAGGAVFRHQTAGGGGHGDPAERAVEDVLADVLDEKLTPEYALREYGVRVDVARGTAERA